MDPASFSFAVIGMFLTCCKGYKILSDAHRAPADAQNAALRLRIELCMLKAWGESWEIRHNPQRTEKFRLYLMRPQVRSGVFEVLCAISETFTNIGVLKKKYGVVFDYNVKGDRVSRRALTDYRHKTSCLLVVESSHTSRDSRPFRRTRNSTKSFHWRVREIRFEHGKRIESSSIQDVFTRTMSLESARQRQYARTHRNLEKT